MSASCNEYRVCVVMASVNKSAFNAPFPVVKAHRGRPLRLALGALLSCSVIAGSAWGFALTLNAMHEASRTLSEGPIRLNLELADVRLPAPVPKAIKSSRMQKPSESEIRGDELTVEAIRIAHQRGVEARLAFADKREKAEEARTLAALARFQSPIEREEKINGKPSIVTALVEDVPVQDIQPFDLVLAKEETEQEAALPDRVPLPEARPLIEAVATDPKPANPKPGTEEPFRRKNLDSRQEDAPTKPERSLFGNLFNRKATGASWPGNDTKVAVYDVSNATVYMPDGTRLRAHSGIGKMRDNPRYEHVTMKGPTPAGVYRLTMREQRFYGVEAIRMTSIDGRDPKNRTGLLTHTNLLRGQIGSHGCVAFQNYQPFLRAFKRGQISMLVVVPELPSSPTQLAALYRKAGA